MGREGQTLKGKVHAARHNPVDAASCKFVVELTQDNAERWLDHIFCSPFPLHSGESNTGSNSNPFYDTMAGSSWYDLAQCKAGLFKQSAILPVSSFASIGIEQQFQVNERSKGRCMALGKHQFGNQELLARLQHSSAIAENRQAVWIVPVMQDLFEDACINCWRGRQGLEEVSHHHATPLFEISLDDQFFRTFNRLSMVEENPLQCRMCLQDRQQECPLPTADIHERLDPREIVSLHKSRI